ncbi:MAG: hypothetical protein VB061_11415 [Christensenella sp.]|nr:hypothetical protein [Christensenella sp.]
MNWLLNAIIVVLAVALVVLVVLRARLKKRLDSIDGLVGVTKRSAINGKVIGGEFTKIYPHKKEN